MREKFEKSKLQEALKNVGFNGTLYWLDKIDSTNLVASDLLKRGSCAPFLVVAREQTAGRGRLSREWIAEVDNTLCMTVVVDLPNEAKLLSSFTARASSLICQSFEQCFGAKIFIKWPNDIYSTTGGKIAGMLSELRIGANGKKTAIFGVGINCFPLSCSRKIDSAYPIAALVDYCDRNISLSRVAAEVARASIVAALETTTDGFVERFSKFDWLKSKKISVDVGGEILTGTSNGVTLSGELLLRLENGEERAVAALEATILKK